jgi:hypothetical protein
VDFYRARDTGYTRRASRDRISTGRYDQYVQRLKFFAEIRLYPLALDQEASNSAGAQRGAEIEAEAHQWWKAIFDPSATANSPIPTVANVTLNSFSPAKSTWSFKYE